MQPAQTQESKPEAEVAQLVREVNYTLLSEKQGKEDENVNARETHPLYSLLTGPNYPRSGGKEEWAQLEQAWAGVVLLSPFNRAMLAKAILSTFEESERQRVIASSNLEVHRRVQEEIDAKSANRLSKNLNGGLSNLPIAEERADIAQDFVQGCAQKKKTLSQSLCSTDFALAFELQSKFAKAQKQEEADEKIIRNLAQKQAGSRMTANERNLHLYVSKGLRIKSMYSCTICLEEYPLDSYAVLDCMHGLCKECIWRIIRVNVIEGKVEILCPNIDSEKGKCTHVLTNQEIELFVKERAVFIRFEKLQLYRTLDKAKDCRWCPRPGCETAMFGDVRSPMLTCPNCGLQFCFNCQTSDWHRGSSCENFRKWKEENRQGDMKFEEWRKKNTKNCPQCGVAIEKNGGCSHMHCVQCDTHFDWNSLEEM
jgi:hypothetical protein